MQCLNCKIAMLKTEPTKTELRPLGVLVFVYSCQICGLAGLDTK